jgi:hypothetical protein
MFDVIMLLCISLPSLTNINTLCTAVDRERFSVFRVDHWAQKSGHLWRMFRCKTVGSVLCAQKVGHLNGYVKCVK